MSDQSPKKSSVENTKPENIQNQSKSSFEDWVDEETNRILNLKITPHPGRPPRIKPSDASPAETNKTEKEESDQNFQDWVEDEVERLRNLRIIPHPSPGPRTTPLKKS